MVGTLPTGHRDALTEPAGTVTDIFNFGGFTTGTDGYLTLLEAGSTYVANGDYNPNGTVEHQHCVAVA